MLPMLSFRDSLPADADALDRLYRAAFPDEDLVPLVRGLLALSEGVLSLVAVDDGGAVLGHVAYTTCPVEGATAAVALLGPLAVDPPRHAQGIGSALVRYGFDRLTDAGIGHVLVLGDPDYYGRFGFKADASISPPYALPADWREAWQAMALGDGAPMPGGRLCVPEPWRNEALWTA